MELHKSIRFLVVITFLLMQSLFLLMIIREQYALSTIVTAILTIVLLSGLFGVVQILDLHHQAYGYEKWSIAVWVPVGAVVCYVLNIPCDMGSVLAAGCVGTVASFLPALNKKSTYLPKLPAAIYCGAFVGMSSTTVTPSIYFVLVAGMLAGLFYRLSPSLFPGVGGKLGTIAFASVVIVSLIHWLLSL